MIGEEPRFDHHFECDSLKLERFFFFFFCQLRNLTPVLYPMTLLLSSDVVKWNFMSKCILDGNVEN